VHSTRWSRPSANRFLMKVFDPARYPLASRGGNAVCEAQQSAFSPEHSFEFGPEMTLDGVAKLFDSSEHD
jgi:hypothetical protein